MKKIITLIAGLLLTASIFAQAPQKMSYQAVIRNSSDVLIVSTTVVCKSIFCRVLQTDQPFM